MLKIRNDLGDALRNPLNHIVANRSKSGFKWYQKAIAYPLVSLFCSFGLGAFAETKTEEKKEGIKIEDTSGPELSDKVLQPDNIPTIMGGGFKTPPEMYEHYFNEGLAYAEKGDDESRIKAVEYFVKAMETDKKKAFSFDTSALDDVTRELYTRAQNVIGIRNFMQEQEEAKKKGSWLSRNWYLVVPLLAAAGYGVYKALTPKPDPDPDPVPQPQLLTFNVINSYDGPVTSFTKSVLPGTAVTVSLDEIINTHGVTDIDTQRIAIWSDNYTSQVDFDTDGASEINSSPNTPTSYNVIVFDMIPDLDYIWMDPEKVLWTHWGTVRHDKRNLKTKRQDFDGQTGPQYIWDQCFDQHNKALNRYGIIWGSWEIVQEGDVDFTHGYGDTAGAGQNFKEKIIVNAKKMLTDKNKRKVANEETTENATHSNGLGSDTLSSSWPYITNHETDGSLNGIGERLLLYVFIKDATTGVKVAANQQMMQSQMAAAQSANHQGINNQGPISGIPSSVMSTSDPGIAMSQMLGAVPGGIEARVGNWAFGADAGSIYAGLGDQDANVKLALKNIWGGALETVASAKLNKNNYTFSLDMNLARQMSMYRAGMAKYGRAVSFSVSDTYFNGVNMFDVSVGALQRPDTNHTSKGFSNHVFVIRYSNLTSKDMQNHRVNATANLDNFNVGGSFGTTNIPEKSINMGVNASADFGKFAVAGSYDTTLNSNTPMSQFYTAVTSDVGNTKLRGSYRYFTIGNSKISSFEGALIKNFNFGNLMIGLLYEPQSGKPLGFRVGLDFDLHRK